MTHEASDRLGAQQLLILAAIVDRLIPADESGPGATEAGAVRYIEQALEGDYRDLSSAYAQGLDAVDRHAGSASGRPFLELSPEDKDAVLVALEQGRVAGEGTQAFFELVLQHTREGMFGDPQWGGNADQAGWALLGYAGPRHVWTEQDQRIEPLTRPGT